MNELKGSITSLDFGDRRIGVARCDPSRTLVTPVTVVRRTTVARDRRELNAVISAQQPVLILVGLPFNLNGTEGDQAKKVRADVALLLNGRPEPLIFWDERLTTFAAQALDTGRKRVAGQDALAAAILLEDYLQAQSVLK